MRALPVLVAVAALCGCEQPWTLLETGTTQRDLVTLTRQGSMWWAGTSAGAVLRLGDGADAADVFSILGDDGEPRTSPVVGMVTGPVADLYAWTAENLWHGTGASLAAVAIPLGVDNRPLLRAWQPTAVMVDGDTIFVASRVGEATRPVGALFEGDSTGFRRAPFADMTNAQVSWLCRGSDGTLWAGDGANGQDTLFRRGAQSWERQPDLGVPGALRVAATAERFFVLTDNGIVVVPVTGTRTPQEALGLEGRFTDLCVFPDGRAVTAGKPSAPWFALWTLTGDRWANINTGTREALWAVYCGADGRITASGGRGIMVQER